MSYKNNKHIIITDSYNIIKKQISKKKQNIISFTPENSLKNKVRNFYSFLNFSKRKKLLLKSEKIFKEFYKLLKIENNLALRKNLSRTLYGCIGAYQYFDAVKNIAKNKKKITIFTEDKNINELFKFALPFKSKIHYNYKEANKLNYLKKSDLLKLFSLKEIKFYFKKKYIKKFSNIVNLKNNTFIHLATEPFYLELDDFLNKYSGTKLYNKENYSLTKINSNNVDIERTINIALDKIIYKYFENNIQFKNYIEFYFKSFLKEYQKYFLLHQKIFDNQPNNLFFLTRIIRGSFQTSLYDYGKINKKKFHWISFQHGHGIEISKIHNKALLTKEETLADTFFVFSKVTESKRKKNIYKKNNVKIKKIGFNHNSKTLRKVPIHDILYLSNLNQEFGQHEINISNMNNAEKLIFEKKLIVEVFSNIKHKVLFKEYSGSKYSIIKKNYISKRISGYDNIIYFNNSINASNIYKKSHLIITSLATSGLGSIVQSEKPFIFIDIRNVYPIDHELIESFKKYFFYFKFEKNIYKKLKNFLNQDLNYIKEEWERKKTKERTNFLTRYFNCLDRKYVLSSLEKNIKIISK